MTFHHVSYREANALREAVALAASGPPVSDRFPRVVAPHARRVGDPDWITPKPATTPVRCRECGGEIPVGERAILFQFYPSDGRALRAGDRAFGRPRPGWLHPGPCPAARTLR